MTSTANPEGCSQSPLPRWGVVTLSFYVPGLGQWWVGRVVAGVLWFIVFVIALGLLVWMSVDPTFPGLKCAGFMAVILVAMFVGMLIHAWKVATPACEPAANRPWIAAFLSSLLAGLGQFYNRQWLVGILLVALYCLTRFLPAMIAVAAMTVLNIVAVAQAYNGARPAPTGNRSLLAIVLVSKLIAILVLAFTVRALIVQPFRVSTKSMAPTLRGPTDPDGHARAADLILVDRLTYELRPPRRGEIAVFRTDEIANLVPTNPGSFYVMRIVGLPGERLSIQAPFVYINGQPVTEPPILLEIESRQADFQGYFLSPTGAAMSTVLKDESDSILLGPDEYFVLGDNSRYSRDSRFWGPIHRRDIIGRVTKIYWPWDRVGVNVAD
jgi:signal peptidase I